MTVKTEKPHSVCKTGHSASWRDVAAVASVLMVLAAPAFAGNGCNDTSTANCTRTGPVNTTACRPNEIGGFSLFDCACLQYRRTADNFQFLEFSQKSNEKQPCIQQNDTC